MKTQAELIEEIKRYVEPAEARRLILEASTTEIVSNRLGRLEAIDWVHLQVTARRDLMKLSVMRVHEVVCAVG
jgi:hypothetical protein